MKPSERGKKHEPMTAKLISVGHSLGEACDETIGCRLVYRGDIWNSDHDQNLYEYDPDRVEESRDETYQPPSDSESGDDLLEYDSDASDDYPFSS